MGSPEFRAYAAHVEMKLRRKHAKDIDSEMNRFLNTVSLKSYVLCIKKYLAANHCTMMITGTLSNELIEIIFEFLNASCATVIHRACLNGGNIKTAERVFCETSFVPVRVSTIHTLQSRTIFEDYLHKNLTVAELEALIQPMIGSTVTEEETATWFTINKKTCAQRYIVHLHASLFSPEASPGLSCPLVSWEWINDETTLDELFNLGLCTRPKSDQDLFCAKSYAGLMLELSRFENGSCSVCGWSSAYQVCHAGFLSGLNGSDSDGRERLLRYDLGNEAGLLIFDIHSKRQCGRCWQETLIGCNADSQRSDHSAWCDHWTLMNLAWSDHSV